MFTNPYREMCVNILEKLLPRRAVQDSTLLQAYATFHMMKEVTLSGANYAEIYRALGEWVPSQQLIDASYTFARLCQALAERLGIRFADAGKWDISLAYDGVHFTEHGHKAFAAGLLEELK